MFIDHTKHIRFYVFLMLFFAYSSCISVHKKNIIGIINKHDHFILESEIFFIVILAQLCITEHQNRWIRTRVDRSEIYHGTEHDDDSMKLKKINDKLMNDVA